MISLIGHLARLDLLRRSNELKIFSQVLFVALTAFAFLPLSNSLKAETIFFSGNLRTNSNIISCGTGCTLGAANSDGDYAQWAAVASTFTVTQNTTMEAITYSYAGGTSQTGAVVPAGGLEPYLSLFDSSGNFLASTFFGTTCPPGAASLNGNCFDIELDGGTLTPGTYQIVLSAFENMSVAENNGPPATLADGFTGLGNLAAGENLNYAFDVILPDQPSIPEPLSLGLFLTGLAALPISRRFRSINKSNLENTHEK